ncbi:uncharacterized protein LOC108631418 [Ceratina calcarata]|uniref:Uncharacterized protein LOC108631418 n=1 Tax=Ceratina calcarata TaxID=156304 RepID=A0AAJ7NE67_9HYME|nr:uncharacterized protein LOC108631418 [Ceratina calcarata]
MQLHPSAFYVSALVLLAALLGDACCDDRATWYNGLRTLLKNCPLDPWNNSEQDFLEKFRACVQEHALATLDSLLANDVIPVFDGLNLIRLNEDRVNSTDNYTESDVDDDTNWASVVVRRILRVLRTHVFKVDVNHLANSLASVNSTDVDSHRIQGRRRRHRNRYNHMVPFLMMGFLLMGSILVPMGFQFLAVLGGKALLLAKMALILSSIQGLKKIATNGVNYGLYHTHDGWHERSHTEPPPHLDLPFPPYPLRP